MSTRRRWGLTDANLLASMVDGAVLVIKAEATPFHLVQRAIQALGKNRIVGVVLNRATTLVDASGYGYYEYGRAAQLPAPRHE